MGSLRFRLTVIYSVVLFGLAAAVLGGIYVGVAATLDDEPVTAEVPVTRLHQTPFGTVVEEDTVEAELNSFEDEVNARALDNLRNYSFAALIVLFFASLGVGWVVAGRALRPIHRITAVAREIQATDLTRRINLRGPPDELRELAGTFDEMLGRLEEAFANQRRFIQEASHELRNPLAVMRTNLEVTLADPDSTLEDFRRTSVVVGNTAERVSHLVDDLLLYARHEVPAFEQEAVDVAVVVHGVAAEFVGPAEARGITIERIADPGLWVIGDPLALRQALANLIGNAVRLAPEGSRIRVAAGQDKQWVWMAVEDDGPGIPAAYHAQIFHRFFRGDGREGREEGRSGLGLSIVRQIAEGHHGEVRLASEVGSGSIFSIWLPAARPRRGQELQPRGSVPGPRTVLGVDTAPVPEHLLDDDPADAPSGAPAPHPSAG
jgi:signal transduction histidine kinase